ncbi:molybdopterin cofactor-binding domain-containing protein [Neorhizobium galegae]|nr:molybdopterin cofactor-binding domain-containing protein [Neorhizobium galegae]
MATEVDADLDGDNRIVRWNYEVWSNPHNNRPLGAGGVLVGNEVVPSFPVPEGKPIPMPEGDGSRNSNPPYDLPNMNVVYHFIKDMPIRVSALRSLGAHLNVLSIETMFDELALKVGIDPLDLRLNHMADDRAGHRPKGSGGRGLRRGRFAQRYRKPGRRGQLGPGQEKPR